MLAALTSAAMPNVAVAGVRSLQADGQSNATLGIDHAVVQDATGKLFDVFASSTEAGKCELRERVRAARMVEQAREPGGLSFGLDRMVAYCPAGDGSPTADTTVVVTVHYEGEPRPLELLTIDDCASIGTAIGAIHRLRPNFLEEAKYPVYTTGQIRAQLTAWIKRLRQAGHVPQEITTSWARIIETDGLWSFTTCPVHGGFADGDVLFSGSTITAINRWQSIRVNDPACDLAWIFAKLDETHRNAVLAAYGRMLGSRLDDLIMLRANLWLQMEQVREFIDAMNHADSTKITQFRAQVERLAHQLAVATGTSSKPAGQSPSTITVGTLLRDGERRQEAAADDATGESDKTGSSRIAAADAADATADSRARSQQALADRTASGRMHAVAAQEMTSDSTSSSVAAAAVAAALVDATMDGDGTNDAATPAVQVSQQTTTGTSQTIVLTTSPASGVPSSSSAALPAHAMDASSSPMIPDTAKDVVPGNEPTMLIPLLEREERAMRDAQADLQSHTESLRAANTKTHGDNGSPQA